MSIEASYILGAMAVGIGATLAMDLWNLFLKRAFNIPSLNYCLLGRWLRPMPGGTFRHASIAAAPPKRFECTVGSITHYTIGIVFALVFVILVSGQWLARPTLLPALNAYRLRSRAICLCTGRELCVAGLCLKRRA